jgi:hypothetical protein
LAYGDAWETEFLERFHRWEQMRWCRELREERLLPDDRLDETGWDIFYCATRVMDVDDAAKLAMDGPLRVRCLVRDDLLRRHRHELAQRYAELHPGAPGYGVFETTADEQIEFWSSKLATPTFIYFIQDGDDGPVKIGYSNKPDVRLRNLQTGNYRELRLCHVIPGDLSVEKQLHQRFEPARIRGEWFGREYLPVIVSFAGGLADSMVRQYDGSGTPPRLIGGDVRSESALARIRTDIERLWLKGFSIDTIAELLWLDEDDIELQLDEMRKAEIYDVHRVAGWDERGVWRAGRPRPRRRRPPPARGAER